MTHKERGLAPFLRKGMDRFPMWYGGTLETNRKLQKELGASSEDEVLYEILDLDYKTIRPVYSGPAPGKNEYDEDLTEWHIPRGGYFYGQALHFPLRGIETVAEAEAWKGCPDPADYIVKLTDEQLAWAKDYCLIGGAWATFFHDAVDLVTMEDLFILMATNEAVAQALIEKCFNVYYEIDRRIFEVNPGVIDMHFLGNDFGSQRDLLMSPEMWRKFFKPYIKKLVEQAKKNGCVTAIHSCGDISLIIHDMIEMGIDAINPIQVSAQHMDPVKLAQEYKDDCVFFGGIDSKDILTHGNEDTVRRETRRIIDTLGAHGRYIVAASHDTLLPDVPTANIVAMYDEAKKYGAGKYNQEVFS
jgi:uroporphyrinogen decarboxylase